MSPRININDLPERYHAQISNQLANRPANPIADLELNTINEPPRQNAGKAFDKVVRVVVHSIRKRLADSDGISAKAAIDGIVEAGILADDSAKHVEEVSYRQTKGEEEQTIITIEEARA